MPGRVHLRGGLRMESTPSPRPAKKDTKPLSVIIGTLLVPLSAVAAYALTTPALEPEIPVASVSTTSTALAVTNPATDSDIAEACGPAGIALVEAEANGTITEVQQAALTALRDICGAQGSPLPAAVEPTNGSGLLVANSSTPQSPPPTVSQSQDDDDHDDDHDDDDDDEEDD